MRLIHTFSKMQMCMCRTGKSNQSKQTKTKHQRFCVCHIGVFLDALTREMTTERVETGKAKGGGGRRGTDKEKRKHLEIDDCWALGQRVFAFYVYFWSCFIAFYLNEQKTSATEVDQLPWM